MEDSDRIYSRIEYDQDFTWSLLTLSSLYFKKSN